MAGVAIKSKLWGDKDGKELLKKGDKVVIHTCIESEGKNYGKVWTCETDEYIKGEGVYKQNLVF